VHLPLLSEGRLTNHH